VFPDALTAFAFAYADQNENDFKSFTNAIKTGRITAKEG
jgi:hypothetical protein